ncbi:WhiB family transcriptional regulator [Streptomyces longispororuber]|uniref:WhiB family transcriptional regulator n=1 Tax=Streptomyces longispororuber TaxID=68230 RepID=UPI0036F5C3A3
MTRASAHGLEPRRAPAWQRLAACLAVEPEVMHPDSDAVHIKIARDVCAACPVTRPCLKLALRAEGRAGARSRYGVFGGLTPHERHAVYLELRRRGITP